jgi:hypothetical protein
MKNYITIAPVSAGCRTEKNKRLNSAILFLKLFVVLLLANSKLTMAACGCDAATPLLLGNSSLIGAGVSNGCYFVSGTFTVNSNFVIDNCTVLIDECVMIEVLDNCTLTITNNSVLTRCSLMWDEIHVYDGGTIIVEDGSTIKHANIGIHLENNTSFTLSDAFFIDNRIGVYNDPIDDGFNAIVGTVTGTEFFFGSHFDLPGSCTPTMGDIPFAGMELNDVILTIGDDNKDQNLFGELNIGILARECILVVTNTEIARILPDLAYGNIYDGSAIYAEGVTSDHSLTLYPCAATQVTGSTIWTCKFGIYNYQNTAAAYGVFFGSIETGIYSEGLTTGMYTEIGECKFSDIFSYGINWLNNTGADFMRARLNEFALTADPNTIAISMQEPSTSGTANYEVYWNTINISAGKWIFHAKCTTYFAAKCTTIVKCLI